MQEVELGPDKGYPLGLCLTLSQSNEIDSLAFYLGLQPRMARKG
jgi:hypothetical protein